MTNPAWDWAVRAGHEKFIAAVVKGLYEHDDPARYFGSTARLAEFLCSAREAGFIRYPIDSVTIELTPQGRAYYHAHALDALPQTRATEWRSYAG